MANDEDEGGLLNDRQGGWLGTANSALGWLGTAATVAASDAPAGSQLLPGVSNALSVVSTATNAAALADTISSEGAGAAYHDQTAYNQAADTALSAAGTAGGYGEMITAGTILTNASGRAAGALFGDDARFSASSIAGGILRGTMGDHSLGDVARRGVTNVIGDNIVGNTLGVGADIATNVAALPVNLGIELGRQGLHEIGAIGSGLIHGNGLVGGGLHAGARGVASGASTLAHGAGAAASGIVHGGSAIAHGIGSLLGGGHHESHYGKTISQFDPMHGKNIPAHATPSRGGIRHS